MTDGLSIGQVAERTGLSVHALRFYEREGILADPVRRESNGRRIYTEDDVDWLQMCVRFRSSGMPLETIRRYTDLVRQGPGNERDRLALLQSHQQHIRTQLEELTECLNVITYKVDYYSEAVASGTAEGLWVGGSGAGTQQAAAANQ
ncbi:MAG TPA: MerR family transcriptional regulator [Kribbella sp.]|uniref:MerR family transcriptional regulator n=1 Tax=Kribbella sp. TaxID=1871183 RepID=UPI002D790E62|nr:MerR family transcriptional regulator [Kribbella sp.]HET6296567.1 MerR family transcriptional regulator [Kribbella sp.]